MSIIKQTLDCLEGTGHLDLDHIVYVRDLDEPGKLANRLRQHVADNGDWYHQQERIAILTAIIRLDAVEASR